MRPIESPLVRNACVLLLATAAAIAGVACGETDRLAEVRALQEAGDLYGSLEPLRELIEDRPDDPEVQFRYGAALATLGHVTQAEFALEKAMEDPKWKVAAGSRLAYGALQTMNYDRAVDVANRVLESEPDNVPMLLVRAEARARARKELELALADAERALELEPDRLDAQKPRILALLAMDRIDDVEVAIEDLGKQLSESETSEELAAWHCATRAVFTEEKATFEKDPKAAKRAEELWKDCLTRFPSHPDVVNNAVEFYDRGDREHSIDVLRAALAKEPTADSYRSPLAARLRDAGKPEEGEAVLREEAEAEEPHRAVMGGFELAEHFQALGDYAKGLEAADRAMKTARELGGMGPELAFEYADALLLAGELDRAEQLAREMTVPAHRALVLARVAQDRGDYQRANQHFEEAFRVWPDNGNARFLAAVAAEASGDFDRAIEQYRYAIRITPGDIEARTRLAQLYAAERDLQFALEMLAGPDVPRDSEADLLVLELRVRLKEPRAVDAAIARLRDAKAAPIARALVQIAQQAGGDHARSALAAVRKSAAAHPREADWQEVLGRALEATGAPREEVRAAYARALERDAQNAGALLGLARLASDPNEALALFDRAAASDRTDAEAEIGAARALAAAGRASDAEARLVAALPKHPLAREIPNQIVELRVGRGDFSDETLALARRAVRLGGGADAWERLSRIHAGRGDTAKAAETSAQARTLREGRKKPVSAEKRQE